MDRLIKEFAIFVLPVSAGNVFFLMQKARVSRTVR